MEKILKDFQRFLQIKKLSKATQKNYLSDIKKFLVWLNGEVPQNQTYDLTLFITPAILHKYQLYLNKNNIPSRTQNRHFSALRIFGQYLQRSKLLITNPAKNLINIPKEKIIEEDPLLSLQRKISQLYQEHKKTFLVSILIFCLLITSLLIALIIFLKNNKNKKVKPGEIYQQESLNLPVKPQSDATSSGKYTINLDTNDDGIVDSLDMTVAYALNARTLQGYTPSASGSASKVLVLDENGWIILGEEDPGIKALNGILTLTADNLLLTSNKGSNGNITLSPDGNGSIYAHLGGSRGDHFKLTNPNITSGALISAYAGNNNLNFDLLNLSSGVLEKTQFKVSSQGDIFSQGQATISGSLQSSSLLVRGKNNTLLEVKNATNSAVFQVNNNGNVGISGQLFSLNNSDSYLTFGSNDLKIDVDKIKFLHFITSTTPKLLHGNYNGDNLDFRWDGDSESGTLFVDASKNQVGIGTTNPNYKLQVVGNAYIEAETYIGGTLTSNHILPKTNNNFDLGSSSQKWRNLYIDGIAYLDEAQIGTTDYLSINTNGDLTFVDADGGSFISGPAGGDLTIQTASNNNLILSSGTGNIELNGSVLDINSGTLDLSTQAVNISLNNTLNALNFDSNTLSLDALNNRVGIGTAGPQAKLEINNSDVVIGLLLEQNNASQIGMQISNAANATASMLDFASNSVAGDVINLDWDGPTTLSGALTGLDLDFANVTADGANPLYGLRINNPANTTASPEYGLYLEGTNWDYGLYVEDDVYIGGNLVGPAGALGFWYDGTNGIYHNSKGVIIGPDAAETLSNAGFALNAGDLFVANQLGVEGMIYTDSGLTVGASTIYADGTITKSTGGALSVVLGGAAGDDFIVDNNTLVVKSENKRIGIGTPSPATLLELEADYPLLTIDSSEDNDAGINLAENNLSKWHIFNDGDNQDRLYITDKDNDNGLYLAQDDTSWTANSDIRLKENIIVLDDILTKLEDIQAVKYNFKGTAKTEIGLIAQQIEPLFPELVNKDSKGFLGLKYERLTPLLLQAVKELNQKIRQNKENLQIAVFNLQNKIDSLVASFSQEVKTQKLASPLVETENLIAKVVETKMIKPVANSSLIIDLNNSQNTNTKLEIRSNNKIMAVIDKQGKLTANNLELKENATISGTLTADKIKTNLLYTKEINSDKLNVKSLAANIIEGLEEKIAAFVNNSLTERKSDYILNNSLEGTTSALLSEIENFSFKNNDYLKVDTLEADGAIFNEFLAVLNTGIMTNLQVNNLINVNNNLYITDSSLSTSKETTLYLQPLGGKLDFLAGIMTLDKEGKLKLNGDFYLTGKLTAEKITSPNDLAIKLEASQSSKINKLRVENYLDKEVASIDSSGSATFHKIIIAQNQDDNFTTSSGLTKTNATAGQAILPQGETETTIYNQNITKDSLIYITPTSDTANKVLYVKNKKDGPDGYFTVALDKGINKAIEFNWWIIN